jgi:hypothetical protein
MASEVPHRNETYIPYYACKSVSPSCPVELTTLGYFPNKGINIFFAIGFGMAAVTALTTGIMKKTWSYTGFITAGCVLELAGTRKFIRSRGRVSAAAVWNSVWLT